MHTRGGPVIENNSTVFVAYLKTHTGSAIWDFNSLQHHWVRTIRLGLFTVAGQRITATFCWGYSIMLLVDATAILYWCWSTYHCHFLLGVQCNVAGGCHCHSLLMLVNVSLPLFAGDTACCWWTPLPFFTVAGQCTTATFWWGYSVMLLMDATAIPYCCWSMYHCHFLLGIQCNVAGGHHCHSLLLLQNPVAAEYHCHCSLLQQNPDAGEYHCNRCV